MTPLQRIQRVYVRIMRSPQFALMSGVISCGRYSVSESCPTAYTDGWDVTYGEKFIATLDEKELAFLVLHENFHKMLRQLTVWKHLVKEDARRANMAADHVVNLMIRDMDKESKVCKVIDSALINNRYRGKTTKEVFDALKGRSGKGKGGDKPIDEHEWGHEASTPEEQAARESQLDVAIRQGSMLAGEMGGSVPRELLELLEPKINWRDQLRDFVTDIKAGRDTTTWRRPNRRYLHQGAYIPSMYSESLGAMVVAIDTSESIKQEALSEFVTELVSICETASPSRLTVLWWDTKVRGVQEFEGDYAGLAQALSPVGSKGTRFACVGEYIRKNGVTPECIITLTDGHVTEWGEPVACPMLFAITSQEVAPFGVTIHM